MSFYFLNICVNKCVLIKKTTHDNSYKNLAKVITLYLFSMHQKTINWMVGLKRANVPVVIGGETLTMEDRNKFDFVVALSDHPWSFARKWLHHATESVPHGLQKVSIRQISRQDKNIMFPFRYMVQC